MNGHFKDIREFLNALNTIKDYVILRNYENMHDRDFILNGHPDIDLLTVDSREMVDALGAISAHSDDRYGDGVHYKIYIGGVETSLDIRSVGDGYYCKKWQKTMIEKSTDFNGIRVMSPEDYFFSLIYHAIFQKKEFANDYKLRLVEMGRNIGVDTEFHTDKEWISTLETYMRSNGYTYTYCTDHHVPLYRNRGDSSLLDFDYSLWRKHFIYDSKIRAIEICVSIKHFLHL